MKKTMLMTALALAAALALSGCIKTEVNIELKSDDTVDGSFIFAVQEGIGEAIGELYGDAGEEIPSDQDIFDELFDEEDLSSDFTNATQEPYNEDGWVGTRVVFTGETLADFNEDSDGLSIVREGNDFIFTATLGTDDAEMPQDDEFDESFRTPELTMSVTFPGEVHDHNGTLNGTTVTWDLLNAPSELYARGSATGGVVVPPDEDEDEDEDDDGRDTPRDRDARSSTSSSGSDFPWLLALGILGALVILGGVILTLVLVSRSRAGSIGGSSTAPPAPPSSPPPPTFEP